MPVAVTVAPVARPFCDGGTAAAVEGKRGRQRLAVVAAAAATAASTTAAAFFLSALPGVCLAASG